MALRLCVVGDVTLDTVTHLDFPSDQINRHAYAQGLIEVEPGGTALSATRAALKAGFAKVSVIAKVGQNGEGNYDYGGQLIADYLNRLGVESCLCRDSRQTTGCTMTTYFRDQTRLLVSHRGANATFSKADLTPALLESVSNIHLLFVSGYWLLNSEQAAAVEELIWEAHRRQVMVVLDVLPHYLHRLLDEKGFRHLTQAVDMLIGEANSLRRLFPATQDYGDSEEDIAAMANYLTAQQYRMVVIRSQHHLEGLYDKRGYIASTGVDLEGLSKEKRRSVLDEATFGLIQEHYLRLAQTLHETF